MMVSIISPLELISTIICIIEPFQESSGTNQLTDKFAVLFTLIFSNDVPDAFQPVDMSEPE